MPRDVKPTAIADIKLAESGVAAREPETIMTVRPRRSRGRDLARGRN
jgi:hypothetical protein|tara:strand:- start:798 stop:938 length:141 start_codon:yes stop_codon:yes gene_type:complete